MDHCDLVIVRGQRLATCACATKACRNGRCQTLVTDTHIDRKICPKHLRGGPGTIDGVPVRYCQRVRYQMRALCTAAAHICDVHHHLRARLRMTVHVAGQCHTCKALEGNFTDDKKCDHKLSTCCLEIAGLLHMEHYCPMIRRCRMPN